MSTLNCETHGDYEPKEIWFEFTGKNITIKGCPTCNEIEHEARMVAEKEEQEERAQKARRERRLNAGISERNLFKTFSDWNTDDENQLSVLDVATNFAKGVIDGEASSLIINGKVGTGKTLLACAIVEQCIQTRSCRMIRALDMIRNIKSTWSRGTDHSEQEVTNYYSTVRLLVIDEIGVQFGSDAEKMILFDIIDARYQNMLPTVIISNLNLAGISEAIGERVIDRIKEDGGKFIKLDWESKRS